ncbi:MAG TPA: 6-phosphofructokinase [Actinobacteria bacterium]|nr:6-phosphofructokinase [Actinomycetota bacterium]
MNVGILTGGGDCPGLNAVIRAITKICVGEYGYQVTGLHNGWRGLLEKDISSLDPEKVSDILNLGGTILGTSRTNPFKDEKGPERVLASIRELNLGALVAIGGDDTLGVASRLYKEYGINTIGVPKTIDNDLSGTDYTFGFDTAVHIATEAIDRLHTTAESHNRAMVVEVMGRTAGWIAVMSGIAGGANVIIIPEIPINVEDICDLIKQRAAKGKKFSIVVVSEGVKLAWRSGREKTVFSSEETDEFGHARLGGVGNELGKIIEKLTGIETRVTILGHIQRGGTPTSHDRILATRYGVKAAEMVKNSQWGMMVALKGDDIKAISLDEAVSKTKTVPLELYNMAKMFFG